MNQNVRTAVAALSLSAAGLISLVIHEGYSDKAIIPVQGDRPTMGFGSTVKEDGTPVKITDTTTPTRALRMSLAHIQKDEAGIKSCVKVPLYQHEYDAYVSLTFNIGRDAFCKSTLVRKLNAGDYAGACAEILRWDRFQGQPLRGLTIRRQGEYRQCLGESPAK